VKTCVVDVWLLYVASVFVAGLMALKRDVIADICFRWGRNGSNWGDYSGEG
jgi:hypothetical protein